MQQGSRYVKGVTELHEVHIDSLAVMKIFKHCKENSSVHVMGQLLGIDVDGVLKITNCFPFIKQQEPRDEMQDQEDGASYQYEIIKCYDTLGYDANAVGWYHSANLGIYWGQSLIETQYNYQTTLPGGGILILCDPFRGVEGDQCIKAMRLKPEFVKLFGNDPNVPKTFYDEVDQDSIFEQIPVKISNTHLYRAFIRGLSIPKIGSIPIGLPIGSMFKTSPNYAENCTTVQQVAQFQSLDNSINCLGSESEELLQKHLECLSEIIEDYNNETWRWHCWFRSFVRERQQLSASVAGKHPYGANPLSNLDKMTVKQIQEQYPSLSKLLSVEPSKIDCLMISNQVNTCCKQITRLSGSSITDLYHSYGFMSRSP